jgi:hypothetical protein
MEKHKIRKHCRSKQKATRRQTMQAIKEKMKQEQQAIRTNQHKTMKRRSGDMTMLADSSAQSSKVSLNFSF